MNDQIILTIAETTLANTRLLQTLVDSLSKADQKKIAEKVVKTTPVVAPAAIVETPVPAVVIPPATPVLETVTVPVVKTITESVAVPTTPVMPPAPFLGGSLFSPAPVATQVSPVNVTAAPFTDHKGMLKFVMDTYQSLPPAQGAKIQDVLLSLGIKNINDVKPEQYAALASGVNALKG